jgi:hypothetical protein
LPTNPRMNASSDPIPLARREPPAVPYAGER